MDQFFIDMVAKKGADGFHKKGQYKLRIKLLLGKSNIFQAIGKKYIAKKCKLQLEKKWMFYAYVSSIRANLNNAALKRLRSFKMLSVHSTSLQFPSIKQQ